MPEQPDSVSVVIAASRPERVHNTVTNLLRAADLPVVVEVVCYGPGLDLVLDRADAAERTAELQKTGVVWKACANTLDGRGLRPDALLSEVEVVPAAVWHLVRRQHEGWAYLQL